MRCCLLFCSDMTSKEPEVSDQTLIKLIYLHLKENGHKKAANVLRKHAPQVKTKSVKASLTDIFKNWLSEESEKSSKGEDAQWRSTLSSSASKLKKPRKVGNSISSRKQDKLQTTAVAGNQKRKRPQKKEGKPSSSAGGQTAVPTVGDDSDSDSSLDVEKWKRLALEFSDADIAKMDALINTSTTTPMIPVKSAKARKPAKKNNDSSTNMKAKPSASKSKAKTAISSSKTNKTEKPLKAKSKKTSNIFKPEKIITLSKKAKNKSSLSEPNVVEAPVNEVISSLSDQVVMPKTDGKIRTPSKNTKRKKKNSHSESNSIETLTKNVGTQKPELLTEFKEVKTSTKKAKSKLNKSLLPAGLDTACVEAVSDSASGDLIFKQLEKHDALPDLKLVETPSKKAKSKKAAKHIEFIDVKTPTEAEAVVANEQLLSDHSETPSKKAKAKKSDEILSPSEVETPKKAKSKKAAKHIESIDVKTPTEAEAVVANEQLISDHSEAPSKKAKAKKSDEILSPSEVKTPKKAKSKKSTESVDAKTPSTNADAEAANLITDQVETPSKKTKAKKAKVPPETPQPTPTVGDSPEPVSVNTPSEEGEAEDVNSHLKLNQLESLSKKPTTKKGKSAVEPDPDLKPSKKVKTKKTDKNILDLNEIETSQKVGDHAAIALSEAVNSDSPTKKTKHQIPNTISEALVSETPCKKSKRKKRTEADQTESSSVNAYLGVESTDKKHSSKKSKSKMPPNMGSDETCLVTDTCKSSENIQSQANDDDDDGGLLTNQITSSDDISSPGAQAQQGRKKRKKTDEENLNVPAVEECPAEPKRRKKEKKKKKERDDNVVEEVPPAAPSESLEDTMTSTQEKKKKKKKKDRDEEQTLPSSPAPEEETPKKKKKSSKEKVHIEDVEQAGHI